MPTEWFESEEEKWMCKSKNTDELKNDAVNLVVESIWGFTFSEEKGSNKASQKASSNSN